MKLVSIPLFCLFVLSLVSCSKENAPAPSLDNVKILLNGQEWNPGSLSATASDNVLSLSFTHSDKSHIDIRIVHPASGIIALGTPGATATYTDAQGQVFTAGLGGSNFVKLDQLDAKGKLVEGSFSFSAVNGKGESVNVSQASFSKVNYSGSLVVFQPFFVRIDGEDWIPDFVNLKQENGSLVITANDLLLAKTLILSLPLTATPGDFTLNGSGPATLTFSKAGTEIFITKLGNLKVTDHNTGTSFIAGTFEATLSDAGKGVPVYLTAGEFSQNY